MLISISLFFFILLCLAGCMVVIWTIKTGISPMPSSRKAKALILESIPPHHTGKIVELGSGWGTLLFSLAKQHPNCPVIGYELSPIPYFYSKLRNHLFPLPNVEIYRKDFFHISLKDAAVVVCYLYPQAMEKLKNKFESELPFSTLIISNTFAISEWTPIEIKELNDIYHSRIYIYFKINTLHLS